jgi:protoheme IX farnesyltransferase
VFHADVSEAENMYSFFMRTFDLLQVMKIPISLMMSAATFAGYVISASFVDSTAILTVLSVFSLAAGSSSVNDYQDRKSDGLSPRTCDRALPKQRITSSCVLALSFTLLFSGILGLLFVQDSHTPVLLGVLSVLIYNGIYTPLKAKTVLAIVPGSFCGMLAPLIGWTVGGGIGFVDISLLMVLLGLWQFPHFWLLVLANQNEYQGSVLPNMLNIFSVQQLKRILFIWATAFAATALMLPAVGILTSGWMRWAMIIYFVIFIFFFGYYMLAQTKSHSFVWLFKFLNVSMGLIIFSIITDRLL